MIDDEAYISIAREKFGITYLRPYQELVIKHILDSSKSHRKTRVLCSLPTGGGKSLCFMLPIMVLKGITIAVYPLISLMNNQKERFEKAGIPIEVLQGGMSREERTKAINRLREGKSIAMLTNMEMLIYLVDSNALKSIERRISMIVIDEVHTAITWGNTFRPSYKELNRIMSQLNPNHILAFSATMDKAIVNGIIKDVFSGTSPYFVRDSSNRENIFYISIPALNKVAEIINILKDDRYKPSIVFCPSRKLAEELAHKLSPVFDTRFYHANITPERKKEVEKWFAECNNGVLFATIAFGMGVDIANIRSVIHYSLPNEASAFLQESGRCGRDGKSAFSFILHYPEEESEIKDIFTGKVCIRTSLLKAMNEDTDEKHCLGCNHCISIEHKRAGEERILKHIRHFPLSTPDKAATRLSGKAWLFRRYRLPEWNKAQIRRAIRILISEGRIKAILGHFLIARRS